MTFVQEKRKDREVFVQVYIQIVYRGYVFELFLAEEDKYEKRGCDIHVDAYQGRQYDEGMMTWTKKQISIEGVSRKHRIKCDCNHQKFDV